MEREEEEVVLLMGPPRFSFLFSSSSLSLPHFDRGGGEAVPVSITPKGRERGGGSPLQSSRSHARASRVGEGRRRREGGTPNSEADICILYEMNYPDGTLKVTNATKLRKKNCDLYVVF